MGLDMYCYAVPAGLVEEKDTDVQFSPQAREHKEEIFYWRKHHDLHGWMENLYREKHGEAESFNCVNVRLTEEDLDRLKEDLMSHNLPSTRGFFFGDNPPDDETQVNDLSFVVMARNAIQSGKAVFYDSWW
jgi:hypothetical protein